MEHAMKKIKLSKESILFNVIGYTSVTVAGLICLLPFILMISGSITDEGSIMRNGFSLIPGEFSIQAYRVIFQNPIDIVRAYGVSIAVTVTGGVLGLFMVSMTAYVLNRKDFKYKNTLAFFIYFTTLFNGGIVPLYILMVRYLQMKDNFFSMVLPLMMNVFYILIMRSFVKAIPDSISESAKVDGAGDFTIFIRLIFPLLKPGLASIGLFIALDYWNDWYNAMLYINNHRLYPLQYLLYNMLNTMEALTRLSMATGISLPRIPQQSVKLAMAVVAIGPIILLYPFLQKYFVQGITVGSVKG